MPNWLYLLASALYHLGLAVWIGGAIALGALTAPALFRALPRSEAGKVFGTILRRFARVRLMALAMIVSGAAAKYFGWETHATSTGSWVWIALRWLAIAVMALILLYELLSLEKSIERSRTAFAPDAPADDPKRAAFNRLHRRAEGLMRLSLAAALIALVFS